MASNMDIVSTDVDVVVEIARQLNVASKKLDSQIDSIFNLINSMEDCWSGDAYERFVDKCNDVRGSLDSLVLFIKSYSRLFGKNVKDASEEYINEVTSALGGS